MQQYRACMSAVVFNEDIYTHVWLGPADKVILFAACTPASYYVVLWALRQSPQSIGAVVAVRQSTHHALA